MAPEAARLLKVAARDEVYVILATSRVIHSVRTLCHSLDTRSPVICANGPRFTVHLAERSGNPFLSQRKWDCK